MQGLPCILLRVKSIIQEQECLVLYFLSYGTKLTLKSLFKCKKVKVLPYTCIPDVVVAVST